jgi:hypothetical protein
MNLPREALKVDVNMYWSRLPVLRHEDMSSAECNALGTGRLQAREKDREAFERKRSTTNFAQSVEWIAALSENAVSLASLAEPRVTSPEGGRSESVATADGRWQQNGRRRGAA